MDVNERSRWFFTFVFIIALAGSAYAGICPKYDLSNDCAVDITDLAIFINQWLNFEQCEGELPCANYDGLNGIDFIDFSFLAGEWQFHTIPLAINEFMASNNSDSGIADPAGDYDDWIEIYNSGNTPFDMAGIYITDNLDNPTKWQIPTGYPELTILPAHSYVLIWADEEPAEGPLHTNFKLSADGEELGLFDTDGITQIDAVEFGEQVTNISYGRYPHETDNFRFFPTPTPGAENTGAYLGEIEDVEFSHSRGFYNTGFTLTLACVTPGVSIYYTNNGKSPIVGEAPATGSIVYTTPINISSSTSVRAAAIRTGWMPSPITTHTYIFGASSVIKAMPAVTLAGDPTQTLYEPDGIMAIVGGYYNGEVWTSGGDPSAYNNPIHRGIAYERPVSFEIFNAPDGNYQADCGIRVHGSDYTRVRYRRGDNWSCNANKFSFNLYFRNDYGENRFEYPFFPFIETERYQSIVLRGGHNDRCSPFVKDEWARRLFLEMGGIQVTGTFANLYINGQHKYYFNPTARDDEEFFREWYGTENAFDVLTMDVTEQVAARDGDTIAWNNLISYATTHNLANAVDYQYITDRLDIATFIDLIILEVHIGNFDWPGNNWTVHRERADGSRFRFSVWDAEGLAETWVFGGNCESCYKTAFEDFPTWTSPRGLNNMPNDPFCRLYRALRVNSEFKQLFADRIHKHFRNGGILTQSYLVSKWWEVQNEVKDVLPSQSTFVPNIFLPKREPYVMTAFETNGLFNRSFGAPVFYVNSVYKFGGYVSTSDIFTITDPCASGGTIYYTTDGSDPRTPYSGAVSPSAIAYSGGFTLTRTTNLRARIYKSSTSQWSPLNETVYEIGNIKSCLRITEIMYDPGDSGNPEDPNTEYIELKNIGASTINLNLVKFDKGIDFTFGPNTLAAGQHILVVKNINAFQTKYGTGRYIAGIYVGPLDNDGERIRLRDAVGAIIHNFTYKDDWRSITNGDSYSLTIINPSNPDVNSWDIKKNWRASAYVNGSPGWDDSGIIPNPGSIVINEVMTNPDGGPDWIELYNTTASPINISGWYLSDSDNELMKYSFAAGTTIAANGYIFVREDFNFGQTADDSGRIIPFGLSKNGERVRLTSALDANGLLTGYREKEKFGAAQVDVSFGRHYAAGADSYDFVAMEVITPGQANAYPRIGPVVITEIMYNPIWPSGGSYANDEYEYVELYNMSNSAITLYDLIDDVAWKFTAGIDYTFPSPPDAVTIPVGGRILVVKNPAAFTWRYPSVPTSIIYGPYDSWLDNAGETLELGKPGDIDDLGERRYICVERINYSDGSHPGDNTNDPWPTQADGEGKSLTRTSLTQYGNDPDKWSASTPTPGS
ncbi:MAG: lamin tail domain-containing protein [Sedimentisphaerales bacterium]|nr:lamin tail domain-containing protein [Sedimentisphaerales bacterium]